MSILLFGLTEPMPLGRQLSSNANALIEASREGNLSLIGDLCRNSTVSDGAVFAAIGNGHLNVLRYFCEICGYRLKHEYDIRIAVSNGHFPILEYISNKNAGLKRIAASEAIRKGNVDVILRYLCETLTIRLIKIKGCITTDICLAAGKGHLSVLEYMHDIILSDVSILHAAAFTAIENGHLNVLRFFWEKLGYSLSTHNDVICLAAANGHLSVLEYIYDRITPHVHITASALQRATRNRHQHVMQFLSAKAGATFPS